MVDIKRQDITLQDRTKWISADEFAWGSYFYSESIQSWYSTKWFRLWQYIDSSLLNERSTWYPVAVCPCIWSMLANTSPNTVFFCQDGRLEMEGTLNGSSSWAWWEWWWWAVFVMSGGATWNWGFVSGDYALAFATTYITKIKFKDTYSLTWQTITNPDFSGGWTWWTIGTWWTITDDGAEHTPWDTWTLVTSANAYDDGRGRIAVKISNCTAWSVTINLNWYNTTTATGKNWWFTGYCLNLVSWNSYTITITPTSNFNGTIEVVNFNVFKSASYDSIMWLTSASRHLAVEWGGDIYISSWNTIDVLSTVDRTISTSKQLIAADEEIVALSQQADSLIIWATNGKDSHQYYWNGVDNIATEVIAWKWQVIKWVANTETICYVLAWVGNSSAWYAYRLYAVSWYQRNLIASNAYKVQSSQWNLEHYHPSKKFAFNDVQWPESMCMFMDNLYLPWCDGIYQYWQTIPWLAPSWSRPINYQNWADRLFVYQSGAKLCFTYRYNQTNYYASAVNERYAPYWYLVTDSLYRDKLWTRKALEKIKLSYKSIPSTDGNIKIYAIVDDDYFWRFDVTWVTNRPALWDVYEVAEDTTAKVIDIQKTSSSAWTITFATVENGWSLSTAERYLTKVSGDWDASLSTNYNYDNMCLIKTIETPTQCYGADFIFWKDFVNNYIPFWHKIQFVVELTKFPTYRNDYRTPEIYELSFVSDITDVTL